MSKKTMNRDRSEDEFSQSSKTRGGKPTRRRSNRRGESKDDMSYHHSYNDWTWYVPNAELLRASSSISFENATGSKIIPLNNTAKPAANGYPGIAVCSFVPVYGSSDTPNSILNVCARHAYTRLIKTVTSYPPFEMADYFMYTAAMDNIFMMYNNLCRAYGIVRHYEYKNRYVPDSLLSALGFDPDDFRRNAAKLRYGLLIAADKISKRPVPSLMKVLARHSYLTTNVFKDEESDKGQIYVFNPMYYLRYNNTIKDAPPRLESFGVGSLSSVDEWLNALNSLLDPIMSDQDCDVIGAYILKSYEGNLFTLSTLPEDYEVTPSYNMDVCNQVHNATILGIRQIGSEPLIKIEQTVDEANVNTYLTTKMQLVSQCPVSGSRWLDLYQSEATPERIMEATRFTLLPDATKYQAEYTFNGVKGWYDVDVAAYGTEIITGCKFVSTGYSIASNSFGEWLIPESLSRIYGINMIAGKNLEVSAGSMKALTHIHTFDMAPYIPVYQVDASMSTESAQLLSYWGELSNATVIEENDIIKLHETALLGELGNLS